MEPKSSYDDTENSNPSSVHPLDLSGMIPLTTEEPVRRLWLKKELEKVNNPETHGATKEDIAFASPPAPQGQNKIENSEESVRVKGEDIMVCLSRQISDYQEEAEESEEEDIDPELLDTTEKNKHIPYEPTPPISRDASDQSIHHQSDQVRNQLLVFAEHVTVDESPNRRTVAHFYGAGIHGSLPSHLESRPSRRIYMLAYDFSAESVNALEWAIGSIMRDGDEIHIAVVSNRDDNPEIVKASGLDKKSELSKISMAVTTKAKEVMGKMMLFNVKLVTHAMMGRVKDKLNTLMREHSFTMVICGSRGRSPVKRLLMGSVSTYLVHSSPAPVAVIRMPYVNEPESKQLTQAHSLSERVKSGKLKVDELRS